MDNEQILKVILYVALGFLVLLTVISDKIADQEAEANNERVEGGDKMNTVRDVRDNAVAIKDRVNKRVALTSAFNDWQRVRARDRDNEAEIRALLDVSLRATQLAYTLAEEKSNGRD